MDHMNIHIELHEHTYEQKHKMPVYGIIKYKLILMGWKYPMKLLLIETTIIKQISFEFLFT